MEDAAPPRLRVLVVTPVDVAWGAELRLLELAPRLAARQVDLVLASPTTGDLHGRWTAAGLAHVPLELPPHRRFRGADGATRRPGAGELLGEAWAVARSTALLVRALRAADADVVQSHHLRVHLQVALAGRVARRPVVLDLHDLVTGPLRFPARLASRLAAATIANSRATAAPVADPGRADVHVINPGVELDRFAPGPPDPAVRASLGGVDGAPLVGVVGRVDPRKGVEAVVRALAAVGDDAGRARLAVVGAGYLTGEAYLEHLRRLAADLLEDRVTFTGARPDIPEVMRAVDVLVNASHAEPFGRSVLEAQASGTAVVATAAGGIPEFVDDGTTGLLVPPHDDAALAAALRSVLLDPELRGALAAAGRRQAEERFGVERQCDLIAALYRRVAGRAA